MTLALRSSAVRVCFPATGEAWTEGHDRLIVDLYPDYQALAQRLPGRSPKAIKHRAQRLGVAAKRHVWTQLEVARLRRMWAATDGRPHDVDLRQAFPRLCLRQILSKAAHIGLHRVPPRPKILGVPILDRVRQRAYDERLTLRELDMVAGTRRYFQQSTRRINWRYIAAAVDMLGGELAPVWLDYNSPGIAKAA